MPGKGSYHGGVIDRRAPPPGEIAPIGGYRVSDDRGAVAFGNEAPVWQGK